MKNKKLILGIILAILVVLAIILVPKLTKKAEPAATAPAASTAAEPADKAAPATAAEPVEEPAPATVTEPVEEPAPATVTEPVEEPAPATVTEPVEEPAPATVTEHVEEPAPATVTEPVEEPAPATVTEPVEEPAPATVTEPVEEPAPATVTEPVEEPEKAEAPAVMSYAEYDAAEKNSEVTVETYVQDKQGWWQDKANIYCQSEDGAYFLYELPISQEDYDKLVPGTKIRVKGFKSEWSGEVEIIDAAIEVIEGEPFIAEAEDVTALLGTDELIKNMNKLVAFKGMTVEAYDEAGAAFAYKDSVGKTDDLYFKVSKDGATYDFCVEFYLRGNDTDVYKAVEGLKVGDVVDLEGYLYWYNGANPHIISVKVVEAAPEPAAEPEKAEEPAAEPEKAEEPAAEPVKAEEPAAEPEKAEEPAAKPEKAEEPAAEPEKAEEPAAEPEKAEEPAPAPAAGVSYDGSEVTIRFYHTMGSNLTAVLDNYIAEFNKLYPNIHVEYTSVGSYDDVRDQVSTEITVGNQPNIAYCYPDHVALYNLAKAVQTLDDYIGSTAEITRADGTTEIMGLTAEQKADFIEGYYNEGLQFGDGKMYTLPLSKSTEVLYYNKTFFEANGLAVPTTWDELGEVCAKIVEIDPMSIPLGYDSEANWFITMTEQLKTPYTSATAPHFLFDTPENRAFIKQFREWYQEGYLTTQKLFGGYSSGLFTSTSEIKGYMSIGSSAGATYQRPAKDADGNYPFEVGIATIPQADPSNRKVISQGPSLCIFKKANPQEVAASWLFVKYLTTNVDFQAEFSMASGYVPVIKSVAENPVYAEFLANADGGNYISALSAKVCLEQQEAYYTSPAFNGSSTARDEVAALLPACLTIPDSADVDAEIDRLFKKAVESCEYSL